MIKQDDTIVTIRTEQRLFFFYCLRGWVTCNENSW
jgi:hypothetical protein